MPTSNKKNSIGFIFGPTGVGKTDFSIHLAPLINAEIVNIDIAQCYTPLTVGTSKPNWKEQSIPHHLFDSINQPVDYSVCDYRRQVLPLLQDIWRRDAIPLLVGGSGFYIRSLLFPIQEPTGNIHHDEQVFAQQNAKTLWQKLHNLDPVRASSIHENDRYRIIRALTLAYKTGKLPHTLKPSFCPPADRIILIGLNRSRASLYSRIDERVMHMFEQGWISEVEQLMGTKWEPFLLSKKFIGYDNIIHYLKDPELSFNTLVQCIQQRTRQYAKRQLTYWNHLTRTLAFWQNTNDIIIKTYELDQATSYQELIDSMRNLFC